MRIALLLAGLLLIGCGSKKASPAEPEEPRRGRMTVTETNVEVYDRLEFGVDSAEVTEKDRVALDGMAESLKATPEIKLVEAQGHADAAETDPAALAQARAENVVAYMLTRGIEPGRLTAKGYGADKPVTAEGVDPAVANRTVVLLVMKRVDD